MLQHCGAVCGGGAWEGTSLLAWLSASFQSLPLWPTSQLGPSGADSQVGGYMYVLGPCGSLQQTHVRLRVSPSAATPTGFYSQRFWGFISLRQNPGLCSLSRSPIVPPGLSNTNVGLPHLVCQSPPCPPGLLPAALPHHLCPGCPSLALLPVWMNVSSLTPWLLDFHTVQICGISGYFLFLNLLLFFSWL